MSFVASQTDGKFANRPCIKAHFGGDFVFVLKRTVCPPKRSKEERNRNYTSAQHVDFLCPNMFMNERAKWILGQVLLLGNVLSECIYRFRMTACLSVQTRELGPWEAVGGGSVQPTAVFPFIAEGGQKVRR